MELSLKSMWLTLVIAAFCLSGACSDSQNTTQIKQPPSNTEESSFGLVSQIPPKPPIPEGVDVAVDCLSIASQYEEHEDILIERGWCGQQTSDGSLQIDQDVVALLDYSEAPRHWLRHSKDLKCLILTLSNGKGGFAYVRKNGQARFAPFPYDNDCQYFGNGVFVDYEGGFVIYKNESFAPVKRTNYKFADTFYNHLSKVCIVKPDKEYDSHGEHFEWKGGQCGYIGTDYKVVEPIIHAYENTPRPKGGKYDGDDPTGIEARMVEALETQLKDGQTLEAVFLKNGCNFQSKHMSNPTQCDEEYPNLPKSLYRNGNSIREIHLRLVDQSFYRGLVVYNGSRGFRHHERNFYWISLEPMDNPFID